MIHNEVHNEIHRVLREARDEVGAKITGADTWLQRSFQCRFGLLNALISHLEDSVLVNHRHFSLTESKDEGSFTTVLKAEVARLKQEVRISERELKVTRNEHHINDALIELKDRFKQTLFEPPQPKEQTPPAQP